MKERGSAGDPTKLGRWTWVCIGGKDGTVTVFISAYFSCKSINGLNKHSLEPIGIIFKT